MAIYIIIFGIFLAIGLFFLLSDLLKLPALKAEKAILKMASNDKKVSSIDAFIGNTAIKLSKHLKINDYKKIRMKKTLNAVGINKTPEEYMAGSIVKALLIGIGVIPCLFIIPIVAPILLILAIMIYLKDVNKLGEMLKEKQEKIELQLPRFTATISQELKNSRDVLKILENFKTSANEEFARELDILTADMRSSGYESALVRFESRINSPLLSDITRGLISVLRGDDGAVYFQMLTHDMKQLELQKLKAQALKIPAKIRKFSFAMLMCFLATYIVIIVFEIIRSMGSMF